MTPEEESVRRGEQLAQRAAAVVFLFALLYFLYNPGQPQTVVATPTDLPDQTPTLAATATVTETFTLTPPPAPSATKTVAPPSVYEEETLSVRRIIEPCCTRERITEIATGQVGVGIEVLPLRPFAIKRNEAVTLGRGVWLTRLDQGMVLSFGEVQFCDLAVFGDQGTFVFCPQGDSYQPFNMQMLSGKDSVGLDPVRAQAVRPGIDKYRGLLVPFNKSDLPK